jgi:hypothetical protein
VRREPGEERRLRGGPVHHPGDQVGRADPVARGGRPLAAARVDGGVAQGRQVHRRQQLRGAAGAARRGAAGGEGERGGAGDPHRAGAAVRAVLHGGGRQQRLPRVAHGGGLRGAGVHQGGVRVGGEGRREARRAAVPRRLRAHAPRLLQLLLQHQERRPQLALRARARRRRRRQRARQARLEGEPDRRPGSFFLLLLWRLLAGSLC